MNDVWDEKPNIISEGYYYNASEMDAWLEKVKTLHDRYLIIIQSLEIKERELEAIKQVIKDVADGELSPYDGIPLETIKEILGDSEFTTKGEEVNEPL